ncbi:MAG: hypothetical protein K8T90_05705 [Planctomycetes bacterium]|nr:hypothetical protein [Planctomycetota bacterium]
MTQTGAFLLTLAIELPIVVGAVRWTRAAPTGLAWTLVLALGANAVTHPLLWLADAALRPHLALAPRWTVLELAVVAVEGTIYAAAGLGARRGAAVALAANAASFVAGLVWLEVRG